MAEQVKDSAKCLGDSKAFESCFLKPFFPSLSQKAP